MIGYKSINSFNQLLLKQKSKITLYSGSSYHSKTILLKLSQYQLPSIFTHLTTFSVTKKPILSSQSRIYHQHQLSINKFLQISHLCFILYNKTFNKTHIKLKLPRERQATAVLLMQFIHFLENLYPIKCKWLR